jgi:hypothetical protein
MGILIFDNAFGRLLWNYLIKLTLYMGSGQETEEERGGSSLLRSTVVHVSVAKRFHPSN